MLHSSSFEDRPLVEEKLAACGNVIPAIESSMICVSLLSMTAADAPT